MVNKDEYWKSNVTH